MYKLSSQFFAADWPALKYESSYDVELPAAPPPLFAMEFAALATEAAAPTAAIAMPLLPGKEFRVHEFDRAQPEPFQKPADASFLEGQLFLKDDPARFRQRLQRLDEQPIAR